MTRKLASLMENLDVCRPLFFIRILLILIVSTAFAGAIKSISPPSLIVSGGRWREHSDVLRPSLAPTSYISRGNSQHHEGLVSSSASAPTPAPSDVSKQPTTTSTQRKKRSKRKKSESSVTKTIHHSESLESSVNRNQSKVKQHKQLRATTYPNYDHSIMKRRRNGANKGENLEYRVKDHRSSKSHERKRNYVLNDHTMNGKLRKKKKGSNSNRTRQKEEMVPRNINGELSLEINRPEIQSQTRVLSGKRRISKDQNDSGERKTSSTKNKKRRKSNSSIAHMTLRNATENLGSNANETNHDTREGETAITSLQPSTYTSCKLDDTALNRTATRKIPRESKMISRKRRKRRTISNTNKLSRVEKKNDENKENDKIFGLVIPESNEKNFVDASESDKNDNARHVTARAIETIPSNQDEKQNEGRKKTVSHEIHKSVRLEVSTKADQNGTNNSNKTALFGVRSAGKEYITASKVIEEKSRLTTEKSHSNTQVEEMHLPANTEIYNPVRDQIEISGSKAINTKVADVCDFPSKLVDLDAATPKTDEVSKTLFSQKEKKKSKELRSNFVELSSHSSEEQSRMNPIIDNNEDEKSKRNSFKNFDYHKKDSETNGKTVASRFYSDTHKKATDTKSNGVDLGQDLVSFIEEILQEDVRSWIRETDSLSEIIGNKTRGGNLENPCEGNVTYTHSSNSDGKLFELERNKLEYEKEATIDDTTSNSSSINQNNNQVIAGNASDPINHTEQNFTFDRASIESLYDQKSDAVVSIVTWNLAEESPAEDDAAFIRRFRKNGISPDNGSDIVLISGQECENIKPRRSEGSRSREFRRLMIKMLGKEYVPLALHLLGGIQFGLFVKRSFLKNIEDVSVADVTCGIGNVFHNKGAIAAFVKVKARNEVGKRDDVKRSKTIQMIFVSAHLAAHVKNVQARDSDFWRISSELEAQAPEGFIPRRATENESTNPTGSVLFDFADRVFFCGDLNYRIDLPRELTEYSILHGSHDNTWLENLLLHDQLIHSMTDGRAFLGFAEGKIAFMPTFKFDKDSDCYDTSHKQRIPAWTDRILFKPYDGIRVLDYQSVPGAQHSDHRPVFGSYRISMQGRALKREPRKRKRINKPLHKRSTRKGNR